MQWLKGQEPVILVAIENERAGLSALQILTYHEIVNDVFGGQPIIVTFCPLVLRSACVFDRRIDGVVHSFGVSGMLQAF